MLMKRVLFGLIALSTVSILIACSEDTEISSIQVDQDTVQSNFFIDDFDLNDIELELTYEDGSEETVDVTEDMVSEKDLDKLSQSGMHTIEIEYENASTSVELKMVETDLDVQLLSIYEQGVSEGSIDGTYEEWLESIEGEDGVSIEDATINDDGELVLTYSDDTETNVGNVVGPKGEDGRKVEFRTNDTHIQWRYEDEEDWHSLINFEAFEPETFELTLEHDDELYTFDVKEGAPLEDVIVNYAYLFEDYVHKDRHNAFFSKEDGSPYERKRMPDESITLGVTFEPKVFTVSMYGPNDSLMDTMDVQFGERLALPQYSKDDLVGVWYEGEKREEAVEITKMPNRDLELYLKYEESEVLNEVPEENIELTLWTAYGDDNTNLINQIMADFPYDNITLNLESQGGYENLRQETMNAIVSGETPDLVLGYADDLQDYEKAGALTPLQAYSEHDDFGVDTSDFITGMTNENYSVPFAKDTEMIVYNKDYFEAQGYNLEDKEYLYWSDLEDMGDMIGTGENQCPKLLNVDSKSNLFANSAKQWNAKYIDSDANSSIDNDSVKDMLNYFDGLMSDDLLTFPSEWEESFGSEPFIDGRVCMTQTLTSSINYNMSDNFDEGFIPVIQNEKGDQSSILQGSDIGIMSDTTDEERLASWLVIKHLTSTENTSSFAMSSGYMPVRHSAFETDDYKDLIKLAEKAPNSLTPDEEDDYPYAQAAHVSESQLGSYHEAPVLNEGVSQRKFSHEIDAMFDSIYLDTNTVNEAIRNFQGSINPDRDKADIEKVYDMLRIDEKILSEDIDLPTHYDEYPGVTIDWDSDRDAYLSDEGEVTQPEYGQGDVTVTLEATLSDDDETMTKSFNMIVVDPLEEENRQLLEKAQEALVLPFNKDNVESDITLPHRLGNYPDVDITWDSMKPDTISTDGKVSQPSHSDGDVKAIIKATLEYEGLEISKYFDLIVVSKPKENLFQDFSLLYDRDNDKAPVLDDLVTIQGTVSAKWNGGVFLYDGETHFGIYDAWDFDIHEDVDHGDEVKYGGPLSRYSTLFQIGERENYEVLSEDNEIDVPVEDSSIEDIHDYEADGEDMDVHGRHFKVSGKITHKSDGENESFYIESIESDEQLRVYHYSIDDNSGDAYGDVDDETTTALGAYIDEVVELEVVYYTDHSSDGIIVIFDGGEEDIKLFEPSDQEKLENDVNALEDQVTAGDDISLPGTVDSGTEFTNWTSSDTSIIDHDGTFVDYPSSEQTITFTGDASLNDESQSDVTFEVTVLPEAGTDTASDVYDAREGDTVYTEGVVYSIYNGGYFIYDGDNSLSISTGDDVDDAEVEVGDNVLVYGSRAEDYHTLPQISSVQAEHVKSEGNSTGIDSETASVEDIVSMYSDDPALHGKKFEVTGTVEQRENADGYDTWYLNDSNDEDSIAIYYQSPEDSISAIADEAGEEITIEVVYYVDHEDNGVLVIFDGDASDID